MNNLIIFCVTDKPSKYLEDLDINLVGVGKEGFSQKYITCLSGENIHIYGRITAIADVIDALGSDRCYKKAWEDEKIFALLKEEKAKHFDPKLVDIFFDNKDEFLLIRDSNKDM